MKYLLDDTEFNSLKEARAAQRKKRREQEKEEEQRKIDCEKARHEAYENFYQIAMAFDDEESNRFKNLVKMVVDENHGLTKCFYETCSGFFYKQKYSTAQGTVYEKHRENSRPMALVDGVSGNMAVLLNHQEHGELWYAVGCFNESIAFVTFPKYLQMQISKLLEYMGDK